MEHQDDELEEAIYDGDEDELIYDEGLDNNSDFEDPIYNDELDKDHDKDLDTPIRDVYEDDNATHE